MDRMSQSVKDKLMMTMTVKTSSSPNRQRRRQPVNVRINRASASLTSAESGRLGVVDRPNQSLAPDEGASLPLAARSLHCRSGIFQKDMPLSVRERGGGGATIISIAR